jgi:hypothetical protein
MTSNMLYRAEMWHRGYRCGVADDTSDGAREAGHGNDPYKGHGPSNFKLEEDGLRSFIIPHSSMISKKIF